MIGAASFLFNERVVTARARAAALALSLPYRHFQGQGPKGKDTWKRSLAAAARERATPIL